MFDNSSHVWRNGRLIPWKDANLHVASHVIHYGSGVFEGIRAYRTPQGLGVFRLRDHLQRLLESALIYRMESPYDIEQLREAVFTLLTVNDHETPYIRPLLLRGIGTLGVDPRRCPVEAWILTWNWGAYLGKEALERGADVCVSSWRRPAPDTHPQLSKSIANYMNSQLIKLDAAADNYEEGIALDYQGYVAEGSGENVFVVRKGEILTPPQTASILPGFTRDCVITLARELGFTVREENIPRELLYIADEVFFTGTASEITPVRSIDRRPIGLGMAGPITCRLQAEFFGTVRGHIEDRHGWLDYGVDLEHELLESSRPLAVAHS